MQKLGAVKTALVITLIPILGSVALELSFVLISGDFSWNGFIKCMLFPGIIAPFVSYAVVRVVIKMIDSETALNESKEKYRSILDNIEDGYYEVDLAGHFTFFNDAMARITGFYHQPESHLFDLVPELYCADYLLGWMGEAALAGLDIVGEAVVVFHDSPNPDEQAIGA